MQAEDPEDSADEAAPMTDTVRYAVIPSLLAITGTAVGVAAMKVMGHDYKEVDPKFVAPKVMAGLTAIFAAYSYLRPPPHDEALFGRKRK